MSPQTQAEPDATPADDESAGVGALGRWWTSGGRLDRPRPQERTSPWTAVIWLTGMDYFSSLAYAPGLALLAAGGLAPTATLVLVLVTVAFALPVYAAVARRSFAGQGSVALLEHLLTGWSAKVFVLVLLGFAATDFVITMTLSAADAARHATENPWMHSAIGGDQMALTLTLLGLLAAIFLIGFREAIEVATLVGVPYMVLNAVVLVRGLSEIAQRPSLLAHWRGDLAAYPDWTALFVASALIFPRLALGLSGFETGVSVMPLVSGGPGDRGRAVPIGRIRATWKLLASAAVIMSAFLLVSSFVTTLFIPASAYQGDGPASGRAISYVAHELLGDGFGGVYDASTILILWFAGASAMAGLTSLVPRYLPRFGMAPEWVAYRRPLVVALLVIDVLVTLIFHANVDAQGNAYATGVLALFLSAGIAAATELTREARARGGPIWAVAGWFWIAAAVFAYMFVDNARARPDGLIISSVFIAAIILLGGASRWRRTGELRVSGLTFADDASADLWRELAGGKISLVPCHETDAAGRARRAAHIVAHYKVEAPFVFLHVILLDNRSEFMAPLRVRIATEEGCRAVIEVSGAVATANTVAYVVEALNPAAVFVSLTGRNLMAQAIRYILWGEGEIGLGVYAILIRYWGSAHRPARPVLYLTSAPLDA